MATSKQTAADILSTVESWLLDVHFEIIKKDGNVSLNQLTAELFEALGDIKGNKSFRDTIILIQNLIKQKRDVNKFRSVRKENKTC